MMDLFMSHSLLRIDLKAIGLAGMTAIIGAMKFCCRELRDNKLAAIFNRVGLFLTIAGWKPLRL
jgi:hypothetical protein